MCEYRNKFLVTITRKKIVDIKLLLLAYQILVPLAICEHMSWLILTVQAVQSITTSFWLSCSLEVGKIKDSLGDNGWLNLFYLFWCIFPAKNAHKHFRVSCLHYSTIQVRIFTHCWQANCIRLREQSLPVYALDYKCHREKIMYAIFNMLWFRLFKRCH